MVILIYGATHIGKTFLAQKFLEKYKYPYLSIDHLKMGLIRSNETKLTVEDDKELTAYLWPIVSEMIKTAIENEQNLIVEGCYVPFNWKSSFSEEYLSKITDYCLVMTKEYIENYFDDIIDNRNVIENRYIYSMVTKEQLITENEYNLKMGELYNCRVIKINNYCDYERLYKGE